MLAIGARQLRELVPMPLAVELMKAVFAAYSEGRTVSPLRLPIQMPDGSGVTLYMPAYVPETGAAPAASGAKVVSVFTGNPQRNLPTINAVVVTVDPATGVPEGLLEGGTLTALRTGAVSGAATDLLARLDSTELAILGAGAQGVTQAAAVCAVRSIRAIRVYDVASASAASFSARLAGWDAAAAERVTVAESAEDAVSGADVICTATTSSRPVFDDAWLKPGAHVNGVGAYTPEMQELPAATVARARVVVDAVEAALHEAGDLIKPLNSGLVSVEHLSLELGHVASNPTLGRQDNHQITLFKSVGNAIQDLIVAGAALDRATAAGLGQTIDLS
jgi:ornithine cyclodeaminase